MSKEVIWSPLSETDLDNILDYLDHVWNRQVTIKFLDKTESLINQISTNPKQFPLVNKKKRIRKCVLTKHNTIYYRENKGYIELLRIFDTRQDIQKRKLE